MVYHYVQESAQSTVSERVLYNLIHLLNFNIVELNYVDIRNLVRIALVLFLPLERRETISFFQHVMTSKQPQRNLTCSSLTSPHIDQKYQNVIECLIITLIFFVTQFRILLDILETMAIYLRTQYLIFVYRNSTNCNAKNECLSTFFLYLQYLRC